ncbi:phage protein [Moraxella macacae 0408225]|uniref:Phage protein n=1 Tax=Moraxella macacae 0408225 TaxID=1230338 RepID=L2F735_9GAMM|nr:phage protein [Moraxella macacae]ELA08268.1 phage protein [Moraxella macacae 0408225]
MSKTVQEWLNEVDYSNYGNYTPSQFALEFVNFIKLVNGSEGEENTTPVVHYRMLDNLITDNKHVANLVWRGAAKTTLMAEYLFLYLAVYGELPSLGKVNLAVYLSDSIDNGVKSMRKNLESRWENSEFLKKYVPKIKFTDIRWEFENIAGSTFIVKAYGAKSGIRGVKEQGKRPQLAILDDLVSDDDARSPTVLEAIKETVHKAVAYAMHPTRQKTIWLGTPFNGNDPLYEAVESGAWTVNVYPVCEKFPCDKQEFKGAWEDRFTYEYVKEMYDKSMAQGKVDGFYQELMLQIMSDDDKLIMDSDINWFQLSHLMDKKDAFNFYITTDFATSEKESADYSFISVWAVNHKGYYFWVDGICARQTMDKNIDDLFRLVSEYNPQSVGIEVSGQQGGFIPWIQREMFSRNIWFTLASNSKDGSLGLKPNNSKLERFNLVVPDFKLKRFYFPVDKRYTMVLKELMLELSQASVGGFRSKHDDGLDTISQLAMMDIWLPSEKISLPKTDNSIWSNVDFSEPKSAYHSYVY